MSQGDADAAEIISEYAGLMTNAYCAIGASVFVCWEYAITLSDEVDLFWTRGFSGATALFFVNRYVVLAVNILNLIGYATLSDRSCSLLARAGFAMQCLQYVIWAAFSALRTFALSKNYGVALLVFILSSVSVGVDFSDFRFDLNGVNIPILGCTATTTITTELFQKFVNQYLLHMRATNMPFVIIVRTCLIAADLILIYVTWSRLGRKGFSTSHRSFVGVVLRDGTIYFVVLVLLNMLHLIFTMLSIDTPLQGASNVSAFTEPVTATLVSRFLIHLQAANRRTLHIDTHSSPDHGETTFSSLGTLVFDRIVGPMESALSYGEEESSSSGDGAEDETEDVELRPSSENVAGNAELDLGTESVAYHVV
ncbi:hypothetical protein L226DRAFT_572616 [Lentinus tigrinus ALCF2SS1-7]|uniref:uncharacterized protein n=1 Tax=Lentinus tigrinus ALCF2SS1-7 TaxID=1328758 RepID=UPI001165C955|nr:hypothetical protein L226DRAFT_572616 [Lentinus tigrinus ALCF2SS1-7]